MKLLDVPHYNQVGRSDCQAACAAMLMDYWLGRENGGNAERINRLLESFSFGFRPESGKVPPAITGLVALAMAESGLLVDFYSKNPDGGGIGGLGFLADGWDFTERDIKEYAELVTRLLADADQPGLSVHADAIGEGEIEAAVAVERPVVAIVDLRELKSWDKSANHAVVITGIDDDFVAIQDPDDTTPHKRYPRELFFKAHYRVGTDCDVYIAQLRS